MSDLPILSILIALPLLGAVVAAFLPAATARLVGVVVSVATLAFAPPPR